MSEKNKVRKISYRNWVSSRDKWREIVRRTEDGENFSDQGGFGDLAVVDLWGYCLRSDDSNVLGVCEDCRLYKINICNNRIHHPSVFDDYLKEMNGLMLCKPHSKTVAVVMAVETWGGAKYTRTRAIDLSKKIFKAIEDDEPLSRTKRLLAWLGKGWKRPTIIE